MRVGPVYVYQSVSEITCFRFGPVHFGDLEISRVSNLENRRFVGNLEGLWERWGERFKRTEEVWVEGI